MKDHKPNTEALAKVNEAIQRVAKKSGSKMVESQIAVEFFEDSCDYVFGGMIDGRCQYTVSGAEVSMCKGEQLDACVRVRIMDAMHGIINLLEDELEKLKK